MGTACKVNKTVVWLSKQGTKRIAVSMPSIDNRCVYSCRHLSLSLFTRVNDVPPDGAVLTPAEECCDPFLSNCRTPIYVWETKCPQCSGSGTVNTRGSRGRRALSTCLSCAGIGFVRRISKELDADDKNVLTLNRESSGQPAKCVPPRNPWLNP